MKRESDGACEVQGGRAGRSFMDSSRKARGFFIIRFVEGSWKVQLDVQIGPGLEDMDHLRHALDREADLQP